VTSSWFFLSTLNYDARSTTHQIYVGLINCRTQLSCGRCMLFITYVSTTCFGAYGHLQVDELTKEKHRQLYLACVLYTVEGVLLDGVRDLVLIPM